jgi:NAD(P)-dependent dehydrogenase (short-subunit alcohol dehydrogenase family)
MKIEGAVALVTGANRGIGKAIAEELLARGAAKVYAGVRNASTVTDARLVAVQLDVTDAAQVAAAADDRADVQIVVNNAGIGHASTALDGDLRDARAELEVNYLALVSMTQAFAPVLERNGGGAFVNMLSVGSWVTVPGLATYAASKAAAWNYTNAARIALKRNGTQVLSVHVGYVDTDLVAALDVPKTSPQLVATSIADALDAGQPEVIVDDFSRSVKAQLHDDLNLIYPRVEPMFDAVAS